MDNFQALKGEFNELCFSLDHEHVVRMSELGSDISIHNVIVGIQKECFGFCLLNRGDFVYQLFYINGESVLVGFLFQMALDNPNRDNLVFMFSNFLTQEFPHLDAIDLFNSFQQQTRFALEKENYFTMTSDQIKKLEGQNPSILVKGKGFEIVSFLNKVEVLREYFGNRHNIQSKEGDTYVYLMLNERNNLMKIGKSIRPTFRERTLQSQEPEIFILSIWAAPDEMEKELHRLFSHKRVRGEWFSLKSRDLKLIKERMEEFS